MSRGGRGGPPGRGGGRGGSFGGGGRGELIEFMPDAKNILLTLLFAAE